MSEEQLQRLRAIAVSYTDAQEFTCDTCAARYTCEYVFDPYNTDGDCLAEK